VVIAVKKRTGPIFGNWLVAAFRDQERNTPKTLADATIQQQTIGVEIDDLAA